MYVNGNCYDFSPFFEHFSPHILSSYVLLGMCHYDYTSCLLVTHPFHSHLQTMIPHTFPPQPKLMRKLNCTYPRMSTLTHMHRPPRRKSYRCSRECVSTARDDTSSGRIRRPSHTYLPTRLFSSSHRTMSFSFLRSLLTTHLTTCTQKSSRS